MGAAVTALLLTSCLNPFRPGELTHRAARPTAVAESRPATAAAGTAAPATISGTAGTGRAGGREGLRSAAPTTAGTVGGARAAMPHSPSAASSPASSSSPSSPANATSSPAPDAPSDSAAGAAPVGGAGSRDRSAPSASSGNSFASVLPVGSCVAGPADGYRTVSCSARNALARVTARLAPGSGAACPSGTDLVLSVRLSDRQDLGRACLRLLHGPHPGDPGGANDATIGVGDCLYESGDRAVETPCDGSGAHPPAFRVTAVVGTASRCLARGADGWVVLSGPPVAYACLSRIGAAPGDGKASAPSGSGADAKPTTAAGAATADPRQSSSTSA